MLQTSNGENLKHLPSWLCHIRSGSDLYECCSSAFNRLVAVEMSDYDERLHSEQAAGTLASKGQLHTVLRASHFLQNRPFKEATLQAAHRLSSRTCTILAVFFRDLKSPGGKTGTRPLPHPHFFPWVESFKAGKTRDDQRQMIIG